MARSWWSFSVPCFTYVSHNLSLLHFLTWSGDHLFSTVPLAARCRSLKRYFMNMLEASIQFPVCHHHVCVWNQGHVSRYRTPGPGAAECVPHCERDYRWGSVSFTEPDEEKHLAGDLVCICSSATHRWDEWLINGIFIMKTWAMSGSNGYPFSAISCSIPFISFPPIQVWYHLSLEASVIGQNIKPNPLISMHYPSWMCSCLRIFLLFMPFLINLLIKGFHMLVSKGRSIFKAFDPVNVCASHLFEWLCTAF